jgi:hypothetical protein
MVQTILYDNPGCKEMENKKEWIYNPARARILVCPERRNTLTESSR